LDKFSWRRSFHVFQELGGRSRAVFTTEVCSNIRLFTVPAAPDSETVSVEKESSISTAILAVHRVRANAEETTVSDMGAGECIYSQEFI